MKEIGLDHHMETSALTGYNIANLFELLTKHLFLENNNKLGEFAEDNQQGYEKNRTISLGGKKGELKNLDLYN
tara:strand:+ start:282 stop:500 length:219 start_codon:yes stop_codon:yes gene_type:complete